MGGLGAFTTSDMDNQLSGKFIHHVFFWLKNPDSEEDKKKLIAGLKTLTAIKTIRAYQIGIPATTNRDVVERTYAVSELFVFDNLAGQESYQTDPLHLKFIEQCSMLWEKVVVYDTIGA